MQDEKFDYTESMRELKDLVKRSWMKVKLNRFQYFNGYKFDRFIFRTFMYSIFLFLFFVAHSHNYQLDYYMCGDDLGCINPFYQETTWKNIKYLEPGEYGTRPTTLFKSVYYVSFGLLGLSFVLNHITHNWRKKDD